MHRFLPSSLLFACLFSTAALCTADTLSGRVVWNASPVSGAIVLLDGGAACDTSDAAGNYTLTIPGVALLPLSADRQADFTIRDNALHLNLAEASIVRLTLYTAAGRRVSSIDAGHLEAGAHVLDLSPTPLAEGVYVLRLEMGGGACVEKIISSSRGTCRMDASASAVAPALAQAAGLHTLGVSAEGFRDTVLSLDAPDADRLVSLRKNALSARRPQLWVWGSETITEPSARADLLAFADTKHLGGLYADCEGPLAEDRAALAAYVADAAEHRLEVELLLGAPSWALAVNHETPLSYARLALAFADSLAEEGRPIPLGIQFDVEPYSLPEWQNDTGPAVEEYIAMYEKLAAITQGSKIRLTACVPRWFDGIMVTRGGSARPLSEWIADRSDRLVLMDYVTVTEVAIADAQTEVDYATLTGKEAAVGFETMTGLDPPSCSFAGKGEAALDAAIAGIRAAFDDAAGFAAPAIHYYEMYRDLGP